MKRLLCILDSLNVGGAETFLMKVLRTLPADDFQMDFIVSQIGGTYSQEVLERGGKITLIPARRKNLLVAFWGIVSLIRRNNYEHVLKLGNSPISAIDLIAAKIGGAKRVGMRSCNALVDLPLKQRCIDVLFRPILNAVTDVKLAPSMLAAEYTFGKQQARKNVHLLHNGVDLNTFKFDPIGRLNIRKEFSIDNQLIVGHIGRFHKQKNHLFLLDVFQAVRRCNCEAVLLLVGAGEMEAAIRKRIRELQLEPYVIFTGERSDVPQLLSAMDVFVFPSLHEGMPNTVIEAQATGLPCVIADTITKEANITGMVQYLSLTSTPDHWAEITMAAVSEKRSSTAPDFIAQGYDIQSVSNELISLFF